MQDTVKRPYTKPCVRCGKIHRASNTAVFNCTYYNQKQRTAVLRRHGCGAGRPSEGNPHAIQGADSDETANHRRHYLFSPDRR